MKHFIMPIVMATLTIQVQAQERNINDLFNDQKTIMEHTIGVHHFNKPVFENMEEKDVKRTYNLIQSFLPLKIFQQVIDFEGNQLIRHLLKDSYAKIVQNYYKINKISLTDIGDEIERFHEIHYNYHLEHNVHRINQNLSQ